jgi:hypothetical protein
MEAYKTLQKWWSDTSVKVEVGPTPAERISKLEQKYKLRLPDDFRTFLLKACPMEEFFDAENSTWWEFDRIRSIPDEYQHIVRNQIIGPHSHKYLFFADHSIWCWAWAISCTEDADFGKVAIIGGNPDHFVANSFSDFVDAYTSDFKSVCFQSHVQDDEREPLISTFRIFCAVGAIG